MDRRWRRCAILSTGAKREHPDFTPLATGAQRRGAGSRYARSRRPDKRKRATPFSVARFLITVRYGLSGERFYPCGEAGNFPARGVPVKNAFGRAPHDFRLGSLKSRFGGCGVAGRDRLFNLAQEGLDAAAARGVHFGAPSDLADALLCLRRISHV